MTSSAGSESNHQSTQGSSRNRRALKALLMCILFCEIVVCLMLAAWWLALIGHATTVTWIGYATGTVTAFTVFVVALRWWYRRRFRFHLRMMLILVSLASLVSFGLAHLVAKYARNQRIDRATAVIAKHHARIWEQHKNNDENAPLVAYTIDFIDTGLTDRELADLVGHPEMMRTDIWTGLDLSGSRVTDHGMAYLSQFPGLTSLDVSKTKVTVDGISLLRDVPTLVSLKLDATQLRQLATVSGDKLPRVSHVRLDDARLDDQAIFGLERWQNLDSVVIMQGTLTDHGLAQLARLSALAHLNVEGSPDVTDAGLVHLKRLDKLQFLVLRNTGVTTAAGAELQESLPNCRIVVVQPDGEFYEGGPVPTFHAGGNNKSAEPN